jgi:hypothetical protein
MEKRKVEEEGAPNVYTNPRTCLHLSHPVSDTSIPTLPQLREREIGHPSVLTTARSTCATLDFRPSHVRRTHVGSGSLTSGKIDNLIHEDGEEA